MTVKFLCVKDFFMETGELSFKKGKVYEFVIKGEDFLCKKDEQGSTKHYMPKEDMTAYFKRIEETTLTEKELEIQVVKEWWRKLNYLVINDDSGIYKYESLGVTDGMRSWREGECVELVVNMYESFKAKESEKRKQELLDKKVKLELELEQINKELEGE